MAIRRIKKKARVHCAGGSTLKEGVDLASLPNSCKEIKEAYPESYLNCSKGCLGCLDCAAVCKFNAIHKNERGVAEVDVDTCKGCGMCAKACPQELIEMVQEINTIYVRCSNCDKGALARKTCERSCIACGACERACPCGAIKVIDNCARIDDELCISCGMCASVCPRHVIVDIQGIICPVD